MGLTFTNWDLPVSDLSQSDRQLISIARSLVGEVKLLILDEPTSSLSTRETDRRVATSRNHHSTHALHSEDAS